MDSNTECQERSKTYICLICGQGFGQNQFSIQCDSCKEWFHGLCLSLHEFEAEELDRFYCQQCYQYNNSLTSVPKERTNNWRHNTTETNPESKPTQSGTEKFIADLKAKKFIDAKTDDSVVRRMRGQQLTFKELLVNGFNVPILVESKEGLELWVPSFKSFTYKSILDYYSPDYQLDVIDVRRQLNIKMKVKDFVNKFSVDPNRRTDVYNCISLEVSNSKLSNTVRAPGIVNKLSWVDNYWPSVDVKPSVSKYCLISMKDSFTDFHIDFGGTSVWYHVLNGEKVFYILKPTKQNLEQHEKWMASPTSAETFFPTIVGEDQCYRLSLSAGQTLFIPTGWIHAVLTPQDSVVFGGNFLHSLNIDLQLKVWEMENRIKTPFKFQFPFFELTHWYAAPNVHKLLEDHLKQKPPKHLVSGVTALIPQLKNWCKKSKDIQNQNEYEVSTLAPKGFNTMKLIKDLGITLKKAIRKQEGLPMVKKRGKSYKDFNLETNDDMIGSGLISGNTLDTSSPKKQLNESQTEMDETDVNLVVDDSTKPSKPLRTQSTDSDTKGSSLKLKLSISGAKEILGTKPSMDSNDNSLSHKSKISSNIDSDNSFDQKKKKRKYNNELEEEIKMMTDGRPEDEDYIYLDLETPNDEESKGKPKSSAKDEAWNPSAKLTMRALPKSPRKSRDEAKREVVKTTIANAAAKIEEPPPQKRQYIKKKPKPMSSVNNSSLASIESSIASVATLPVVDSPAESVSSSVNSGTGSSKTGQTSNQMNKKPKKGLKTPKQRLHKIICQKKRLNF